MATSDASANLADSCSRSPRRPRSVNATNLIARLIAPDRGLWVTTLTLKRVRLCFKESEREPQPTFYVLTAKAVAIV